MAGYYYLVASLPALYLDEPAPLTAAEFAAETDAWLPPDEAADIRRALAGDLAGARQPCLRDWHDADTQVRNAVARQRAARRRADAAPFLAACRDHSVRIEHAVAEAFAKPGPLERELSLDRLRWALLDDLPGIDPFGFPAVAAYAVKLTLVLRWNGLTEDGGRAALDRAVAHALADTHL